MLRVLVVFSLMVASPCMADAQESNQEKGKQPKLDFDPAELTSITDEQIESLINDRGNLSLVNLNGLTSITDQQAEKLGELQGFLSLDGLTSITDQQAESLTLTASNSMKWRWEAKVSKNKDGQYEGDMYLPDLGKTGTPISRFEVKDGRLTFDVSSDSSFEGKLEGEQTDKMVAVGKLKWGEETAKNGMPEAEIYMKLTGVTKTSKEATVQNWEGTYAEFQPSKIFRLSLNGLTSITDEQAEIFNQFGGILFLNGLTSITDQQAESLSKAVGGLNLNGITSITDQPADGLGKPKGGPGARAISIMDQQVDRLGPRGVFGTGQNDYQSQLIQRGALFSNGLIYLNGLTSITNKQFKIFSQALQRRKPGQSYPSLIANENQGGYLWLNGLTSITDQQVESLGKVNGGCLWLNGLTSITDQQAESLGQHLGLSLNGLTAITDPQAESLGKNNFCLSLNGLTSVTGKQAAGLGNGGFLSLNGLTSITDQQAKSFGKMAQGNSLSLNGLTSITDKQIESLGKNPIVVGGQVTLNGLTSITDQQARQYGVIFGGLTSITDKQAESLGKNTFCVSINGLTSITNEQANILSKGFSFVSLNGLTSITDQQAESFSKIGQGRLYLNGLTSITDKQAESLSKIATLSLNGLTTITDQQAASLGKPIFKRGYHPKGHTLQGVSKYLNLTGITSITDKQAESLCSSDRNNKAVVFAFGMIDFPQGTPIQLKAGLKAAIKTGELTEQEAMNQYNAYKGSKVPWTETEVKPGDREWAWDRSLFQGNYLPGSN